MASLNLPTLNIYVDSDQDDLTLLSAQNQLEHVVNHFYDGIDRGELSEEEQQASEQIRYHMIRQACAIQSLLIRRYGCND